MARNPVGNIVDTLVSSLLNENTDIVYRHIFNGESFEFDSREIKKIVGDDLSDPEILGWTKEYIAENIENIDGGAVI